MVIGGWRTSNQLCSSAFAQRKEEKYESANKEKVNLEDHRMNVKKCLITWEYIALFIGSFNLVPWQVIKSTCNVKTPIVKEYYAVASRKRFQKTLQSSKNRILVFECQSPRNIMGFALKESFQLYHFVADDFMRKSRHKRRGIATLLVEENHTPNVLHRKRGL